MKFVDVLFACMIVFFVHGNVEMKIYSVLARKTSNAEMFIVLCEFSSIYSEVNVVSKFIFVVLSSRT